MVPPTVSMSTASTSVVTRTFRPRAGASASASGDGAAVLSVGAASGARGTSAPGDAEPSDAASGTVCPVLAGGGGGLGP